MNDRWSFNWIMKCCILRDHTQGALSSLSHFLLTCQISIYLLTTSSTQPLQVPVYIDAFHFKESQFSFLMHPYAYCTPRISTCDFGQQDHMVCLLCMPAWWNNRYIGYLFGLANKPLSLLMIVYCATMAQYSEDLLVFWWTLHVYGAFDCTYIALWMWTLPCPRH